MAKWLDKYEQSECDSCKKAQLGKKYGKSEDEVRRAILKKADEVFTSGKKPYELPESVLKAGANKGYVCIRGVCGILTDAGFLPDKYYTNTSFAKDAPELGFGNPQTNINLLKEGDVFMHLADKNEQGNLYPSHAEIFKGWDGDMGEFYDYYDLYNSPYKTNGIRRYAKSELENRLRRKAQNDQSDTQAQFYSLAGSEAKTEKPYPYNLPENELKDWYERTHASNTTFIAPDSKIDRDMPLYYASGENIRQDTKDELVSMFNNKDLDKQLKRELKITDHDLQRIKPLIYGVIGQESQFNNPRSVTAGAKYMYENMFSPEGNSLGPGQVKLKSITPAVREAFGIAKGEDLQNLKNTYIGLTDIISNAVNYTDKYVTEETHPNLVDKDRFERALYFLNSPGKVRKSDSQNYNESLDDASYFSRLTEEGRQENVDRANKTKLSMDPGSYPAKVLKRAKELQTKIKYEDPSILPEVLVTSTKKEKNGGWLDKYEQGGLILKKKTKDNYGKKPNVNDVKVSAGPNFVGEGYTAYNWKSPAWGGQFAMGGSLPGSVGFTYARVAGSAPANGKYTKKTKASAQDGKVLSPDADDRSILGFRTSDPAFQNVKSNAFVPFDPNNFEGIRQNIAGYMSSPLYMDRLSKSIPDAENAKDTQQRRLNNLLSIKLNPKTVNEGTNYNRNQNRINLDATDFIDNAAISHEIAHGIVPNLTTSYGKQNMFAKAANVVGDLFQPFEQFSNSELEKINRPLSGKITAPNFDYMMARKEEHYKPQGSKASAKTAANETYGDLTGMRQLLLDNGITTEFGQDLTPEIFKKATENKRVMNSPAFKRMKLKFKDEDIIKMNNEVAMNDNKKDIPQAQLGIGLIPYVTSAAANIAASIPTMEEVKGKAIDVIKNSPKLRKAINKGISYVANTDWGKEKIKNFANNIDPHGYGNGYLRDMTTRSPFNRIYSAAILNKKEDSRKEMDSLLAAGKADPGDSLRVDLINQYAGLPQKYNTVKPSAYKPTMGNKNDKYYSSPIIERQLLSDIDLVAGNVKMKPVFKTKQDLQNFVQKYFGGEKGKGDNYVTPIEGLGTATTGVGEDEKGIYLSYYDNWDLNPYHGVFSQSDDSFEDKNDKLGRAILGNEKEDIATKKIGTPTQMYGRIYFDKKTGKPKMQNGGEMSFYQNGLDFKPKSISKNGSVIKDDRGQWAHPGEVTEIGSNDITMQGVNYPVLGISDTGDTQMMYPDQDYKFDGEKVTEYPMAQNGKWLDKYKDPLINLSRNDQIPAQPTFVKEWKQKEAYNKQQKEREIKEAQQREVNNRSYISQDRSTTASRAADKQRQIDDYVAEAQRNSPLAQTLGSFTASGNNPEAGAIAARTISDMNPIMSGVRMSRAIRDPENNPYGIGQGKGYTSNILGGIGLLGDVFDVGAIVTSPAFRGAANMASNIDRVATRTGNSAGAKTITNDIKNAFYKEIGQPGSFNIYNKDSKNLQMFDAAGKEIATQKVLKPKAVQAHNKSLPGNYKTGATPPPPEGLAPYYPTEIDWGKWNPEIPKNFDLLQEYVGIEQDAKMFDTWMKNPDGSKFAGTPEQFVQSRSENFKKAFPQGADVVYRGDRSHYEAIRGKGEELYGKPIFTTPDKELAKLYAYKEPITSPYYSPNIETVEQKLQRMYGPDMTVEKLRNEYPEIAGRILETNDGGLYELAIPKTTNELTFNAGKNLHHYLSNPEVYDKLIKEGIVPHKRPEPGIFDTDNIAELIEKTGLDRATIKNVNDGKIADVLIHNQRPGKYAKSLRGNNGMFDMNNPNIYKALIPAVGIAGIAGASKKKKGGWLNKYK